MVSYSKAYLKYACSPIAILFSYCVFDNETHELPGGNSDWLFIEATKMIQAFKAMRNGDITEQEAWYALHVTKATLLSMPHPESIAKAPVFNYEEFQKTLGNGVLQVDVSNHPYIPSELEVVSKVNITAIETWINNYPDSIASGFPDILLANALFNLTTLTLFTVEHSKDPVHLRTVNLHLLASNLIEWYPELKDTLETLLDNVDQEIAKQLSKPPVLESLVNINWSAFSKSVFAEHGEPTIQHYERKASKDDHSAPAMCIQESANGAFLLTIYHADSTEETICIDFTKTTLKHKRLSVNASLAYQRVIGTATYAEVYLDLTFSYSF
jgi:hypothetical protein